MGSVGPNNSGDGDRINARRASGPAHSHPNADPKSFSQFRSPSYSSIKGLSQMTRTGTAPVPPRPQGQRSKSGSADTGNFAQYTTASPSSATADLPADDAPPIPTAKRSMTASPSVFGMSSLGDGWATNVWHGRSGTGTSGSDGSQGAGPTAVGAGSAQRQGSVGPQDHDVAPGAGYTRSPLLPPESGAAWSNAARQAPGWPSNLASPSGDFALDPQPSPTATKSASVEAVRQRQAVAAAARAAALRGHEEAPIPISRHLAGNQVSAPDDGRPKNLPPAVAGALEDDDRRSNSTPPGVVNLGAAGGPASYNSQGAQVTQALKQSPKRSATLNPSTHLQTHTQGSASPRGLPLDAGMRPDEVAIGLRGMTIQDDYERQQAAQPAGQQPPCSATSPQRQGRQFAQRPSFPYGYQPEGYAGGPLPYHVPGSRSPDPYPNYASAGIPGTMSGMPMDMSGYESYRGTPDPYAPQMGRPMFSGLPGSGPATGGPPSAQGSTPQSPRFSLLHMQGSMPPRNQSDVMMYPYGPGVPPHMAGRPPPPPPQYAYGPGTMAPMMMAGPPPPPHLMYPPQSPMTPHLQGQAAIGSMSEKKRNLQDQQMMLQQQQHQHQHHISHQQQILAASIRRQNSQPDLAGPMLGMPIGPSHAGFHPGHVHSHSVSHGQPPNWQGRGGGHRRMPTGPGGMIPMGYNGAPVPTGLEAPGTHGAQPPTMRSALLEDFRSRNAKNRRFELSDIYGNIVEFSGDQHGSRFIQEKLDGASSEEKERVFEELLPDARQLMTDVFGNYVIQKMFEHGSQVQKSVLAKEMEGHILTLSLGTYGCRVVQKALEHVLVEQQVALAEELQGHVLQCVKDQNANHVIQKIIERVSPSRIDFIPKAFEGQVFQLAAHCYSCRVLQRIFEHCDGSQSRPLLEELHRHTKQLMQDQYGNYVVQWVLQRGSRADKDAVVAVAKGQILALSRHKFASNVVEGIIRAASAQDKQDFIEEILAARPVNEGAAAPGPRGAQQPPTGPAADAQQTSAAVIMMKDQFANYVLQRFLEVAQGEQRARLVATVRPQLISMRRYSSGYAKHLAAIEKLLDEHNPANGTEHTPKSSDATLAPQAQNGTTATATEAEAA